MDALLYFLVRILKTRLVGDDYLDQIKRVIGILGTPSSEDMQFIGNDLAKKFVRSLPKRTQQAELGNTVPEEQPCSARPARQDDGV